LDDSI